MPLLQMHHLRPASLGAPSSNRPSTPASPGAAARAASFSVQNRIEPLTVDAVRRALAQRPPARFGFASAPELYQGLNQDELTLGRELSVGVTLGVLAGNRERLARI